MPAPVPSVHCEARKVAYRQTKDGLVVSFIVHPNDMPDALAVAPLGQRYMLALAAIGDDEQPIPLRGNDAVETPPTTRSEIGKQRYASSSDMEKALIRAARLPDDVRFRAWAIPSIEGGRIRQDAKELAIDFIRDTCCAGKSRKLIAEDRDCYEAFMRMEASFLVATGVLAEPR